MKVKLFKSEGFWKVSVFGCSHWHYYYDTFGDACSSLPAIWRYHARRKK